MATNQDKDMTQDDMTLKIVTRIVIGITAIAISAIGGCSYVRITAMQQGYEEQSLPGQTQTGWVKKSPEAR